MFPGLNPLQFHLTLIQPCSNICKTIALCKHRLFSRFFVCTMSLILNLELSALQSLFSYICICFRAPRQRHGRAVSWAAPPAAPEATKRGRNGETSAAARRGRPRRGTVRTATSTAHACPSKASSLGRHDHRPDGVHGVHGVHGVQQPMSHRSCRAWWPLGPRVEQPNTPRGRGAGVEHGNIYICN